MKSLAFIVLGALLVAFGVILALQNLGVSGGNKTVAVFDVFALWPVLISLAGVAVVLNFSNCAGSRKRCC